MLITSSSSKPPAALTILAALAILAAPASGQEDTNPRGCHIIGPDGPVRVIAYKFAVEDPPSYAFRVVNNSDAPIFVVSIGSHPYLLSIDHQPSSITAPEGWRGIPAYGYESPYMHYFWEVTEPADGREPVADSERRHEIQPGESLSGFSIQLREHIEPYTEDGTLFVQEDLRHVSFEALVASGACYVGRVQPDGF